MKTVLQMAPLRLGGITELVLNIAETTDNNKVKFDYLCFAKTFENSENRAKACGGKINLVDLTSRSNAISRGLFKFFEVIKVVRKNGYKVIHINSSTPYEVIVAASAKLGGAKKIIFHSHNSSYYPGQKLTKATKLFKAVMPLFVTDYIACSHEAAKFMFPKNVVKKGRYTVIKNGVNVPKLVYNPAVREEYRKKYSLSDNYVLGHVGRFNVQKNHTLLIDIFAQVYKQDSSARLFLVGIGETEQEIKDKVSKLGLGDAVIFHGLSNEATKLMQMMDVFVMPSLYEGLPVAGVEAQATGLPMVISDTITDELKLIEDVKYIPLDADVKVWADCILSYKNHNRKDTGRMITKAGYDITDTANQLVKLYCSK